MVIEQRTTRKGISLAYDLAMHLLERQPEGVTVVIAHEPYKLFLAVTNHWEQAAKKLLTIPASLSTDTKQRLERIQPTRLIVGIKPQHAHLRSINFLKPEEFTGIKTAVHTLYLTCAIQGGEGISMPYLSHEANIVIYNNAMQPLFEK